MNPLLGPGGPKLVIPLIIVTIQNKEWLPHLFNYHIYYYKKNIGSLTISIFHGPCFLWPLATTTSSKGIGCLLFLLSLTRNIQRTLTYYNILKHIQMTHIRFMHSLTHLLTSIGLSDLQKKPNIRKSCHWYKIQQNKTKQNFNNKTA